MLMGRIALSLQGSFNDMFVASQFTTSLYEKRRYQAEQMGKLKAIPMPYSVRFAMDLCQWTALRWARSRA